MMMPCSPSGDADREWCVGKPDGLMPHLYVDGDNDEAYFSITIIHKVHNDN